MHTKINWPAGSPPVRNSCHIRVHRPLNLRPVIILLCIVLGAWIITITSSSEQCIFESNWWCSCGIGAIGHWRGSGCRARGSVDAVLINVPKLMVHGIVHGMVTLARIGCSGEVTTRDDWSVGSVRYHGVSPPIGNCAEAVIVIVCDRIAYLQWGRNWKCILCFRLIIHQAVNLLSFQFPVS